MESTTCPQEVRSSNRKRAIRRVHGTKEWKLARANFLKDHPLCQEHERVGLIEPATTPHHPHMASTRDGLYLDLSGCTPLCNKCHFALHKGMNLCSRCKAHYKRWDQEICFSCFSELNPDLIKAREEKAAQYKADQKTKRRIAKGKAQMRWVRQTIKEDLLKKGITFHINVRVEAVIQFIRKTRNPASIRAKRLHEMVEKWVDQSGLVPLEIGG